MPRISLYHAIESAPLAAAFRRPEDPEIELSTEPQDRGEFLFAEQECDAALVSPLVYGKDAGEMLIVPGCSIASLEGTNCVRLVFRKGLHRIAAVSVPANRPLERMLMQILLAEKYDMRPALVERRLPAGESFTADVDALLLAGDEAATEFREVAESMDVVDEWIDLTELPFVHALWAMWGSRADRRIVESIRRATRHAADRLAETAESESARLGIPAAEIADRYARFSYTLDEEILDGLNGFYRMAFFHGFREDVPDLNFWEE